MEGKGSDWRPGPTVCRCCLTEGCYKDISTEYFWMGKREVYSEMLAETLNVSIAYSKSGGPNSNSRLICEPCISRLRDASEFKRQVIDCEKTFMHHLDPGSSSKLREVETIGEVKVELVKREKETNSDDDFDDRPDFLDVDTDDDLDDQPLTKLASKIPKKEAVDILELLDSSQITVKRKSNLKLKAPPKKIVKKKEVVPKPSASKPAAAKQAEKKKDEWTTTDACDSKVTHSMSLDEWITTDCKDTIRIGVKVESTDLGPSKWETRDLAQSVKVEFIENSESKVDEWIVTDGSKTVQNEVSVNKANILSSEKETVDKSLKNKTSKKLSTYDKTIHSQPKNNETSEPTRDKIWTRLGKKNTKVVVSSDKASTDKIRAKNKTATKERPKRDRRFVDKKFLKNARLLVKHTTAIPMRIQLSSIDVACFACECKFDDPFAFRDHFLAEHKSVDKTKGMHLYNNVQTRVDITDLACSECTTTLDTLETAAQHLIQKHEIPIDLKERLGVVPLKFPLLGQYICALCPRKCVSFRDLYRHSGSHFPIHLCEICGKKFESTPSLRSHISHKHVDGHPCRNCKAVLPSALELRQHVRGGCTGFKCKICNITFSSEQLLLNHRETVHGATKRVYKCTECQIVFEKRMQRYFHTKREHTDHHKCLHCGKPFPDSASLRDHMLVHTGDRPYECHICQQAFKNRSYYKKHIGKCKV